MSQLDGLKPWAPGQSGNPGGRPKGDAWFRRLCRKRTMKALRALEAALAEPSTAVAAAKAILEFGWGKAPATVTLPDDKPSNAPSVDEAQAAADRLRARAH